MDYPTGRNRGAAVNPFWEGNAPAARLSSGSLTGIRPPPLSPVRASTIALSATSSSLPLPPSGAAASADWIPQTVGLNGKKRCADGPQRPASQDRERAPVTTASGANTKHEGDGGERQREDVTTADVVVVADVRGTDDTLVYRRAGGHGEYLEMSPANPQSSFLARERRTPTSPVSFRPSSTGEMMEGGDHLQFSPTGFGASAVVQAMEGSRRSAHSPSPTRALVSFSVPSLPDGVNTSLGDSAASERHMRRLSTTRMNDNHSNGWSSPEERSSPPPPPTRCEVPQVMLRSASGNALRRTATSKTTQGSNGFVGLSASDAPPPLPSHPNMPILPSSSVSPHHDESHAPIRFHALSPAARAAPAGWLVTPPGQSLEPAKVSAPDNAAGSRGSRHSLSHRGSCTSSTTSTNACDRTIALDAFANDVTASAVIGVHSPSASCRTSSSRRSSRRQSPANGAARGDGGPANPAHSPPVPPITRAPSSRTSVTAREDGWGLSSRGPTPSSHHLFPGQGIRQYSGIADGANRRDGFEGNGGHPSPHVSSCSSNSSSGEVMEAAASVYGPHTRTELLTGPQHSLHAETSPAAQEAGPVPLGQTPSPTRALPSATETIEPDVAASLARCEPPLSAAALHQRRLRARFMAFFFRPASAAAASRLARLRIIAVVLHAVLTALVVSSLGIVAAFFNGAALWGQTMGEAEEIRHLRNTANRSFAVPFAVVLYFFAVFVALRLCLGQTWCWYLCAHSPPPSAGRRHLAGRVARSRSRADVAVSHLTRHERVSSWTRERGEGAACAAALRVDGSPSTPTRTWDGDDGAENEGSAAATPLRLRSTAALLPSPPADFSASSQCGENVPETPESDGGPRPLSHLSTAEGKRRSRDAGVGSGDEKDKDRPLQSGSSTCKRSGSRISGACVTSCSTSSTLSLADTVDLRSRRPTAVAPGGDVGRSVTDPAVMGCAIANSSRADACAPASIIVPSLFSDHRVSREGTHATTIHFSDEPDPLHTSHLHRRSSRHIHFPSHLPRRGARDSSDSDDGPAGSADDESENVDKAQSYCHWCWLGLRQNFCEWRCFCTKEFADDDSSDAAAEEDDHVDAAVLCVSDATSGSLGVLGDGTERAGAEEGASASAPRDKRHIHRSLAPARHSFLAFTILRRLYFLLAAAILFAQGIIAFGLVVDLALLDPDETRWRAQIITQGEQLCRALEIPFQCSGWRAVCNAPVISIVDALSHGCPYCPETQEVIAQLNFTTPCFDRFTMKQDRAAKAFEILTAVFTLVQALTITFMVYAVCLGAYG